MSVPFFWESAGKLKYNIYFTDLIIIIIIEIDPHFAVLFDGVAVEGDVENYVNNCEKDIMPAVAKAGVCILIVFTLFIILFTIMSFKTVIDCNEQTKF